MFYVKIPRGFKYFVIKIFVIYSIIISSKCDKMQLLKIENDLNYKEFKLCNDDGDIIVSFDVEISNETALISYETREEFRNQGFASLGLNMLKNILFSDTGILFLELINLSGDYSRKVAENAGFLSPNYSIDYYILLNSDAEIIIDEQIHQLNPSFTKYTRQITK